jgi:hypothetical protein
MADPQFAEKALLPRMVTVPALHVGKMADAALSSLSALRQQMAPLTMRLASILRRRGVAPGIVLVLGDKLDVGISNTRAIHAKMVALQPDRASGSQEVMNPSGLAVPEKLTIAVRFDPSSPEPARPKLRAMFGNRAVLVDLLPEAFFRRSMRCHKAGNLNTKARRKNCYG